MKTIDAQTVNQIVDREKDSVLIDVLPEEQFKKEHIPGAKNIPLESSDFLQRVERLVGGKSDRVIVYCASQDCDLSPKAAQKLESAGYTNVADFIGGIKEWKDAGLKVSGGR